MQKNDSKWFLSKVKQAIRQYNMIESGDRVAVAVSCRGGGISDAIRNTPTLTLPFTPYILTAAGPIRICSSCRNSVLTCLFHLHSKNPASRRQSFQKVNKSITHAHYAAGFAAVHFCNGRKKTAAVKLHSAIMPMTLQKRCF